ncbi:serine acetyltransferase [Clostridium estertheticum]|uniref:Serine acetyltransferase n=1 Tax=Clostridium estertheticum TaxID=238834 RepID=A0A5N7J7Z4_9CLOT|nr:serine O-acetyltransferase EpsC [Clostridium estertheticum]MPQ34063.1 serine acetyltransferase [Clostridium estertheticum]MPQ64864.1 serine acetyltransferase [Clostridium estertheticum]
MLANIKDKKPEFSKNQILHNISSHEKVTDIYDQIINITNNIEMTCKKNDINYHTEFTGNPSISRINDIAKELFEILFPGVINNELTNEVMLKFYLGKKLEKLYEKLEDQIFKAYLTTNANNEYESSVDARMQAKRIVMELLEYIPVARTEILYDIEAAYEGDPAAMNYNEIVLSYPFVKTIAMHRIAHFLYLRGISIIPRMLSEWAHSRTGIDIHPGAKIGKCFFIDHGTGVVIGETTEIGDNVKIYQGVTLGALSLKKNKLGKIIKGGKRHPTLKDNVVVYANATILGGDTVIGENSIIGGNAWIIHSVEENTVVTINNPKLQFRRRNT